MKNMLGASVLSLLLILLLNVPVLAQSTSGVIEGKDNWLFPRWESLTDRKQEGERAAANLIAGVGKALAARDIKLIVFIVPMKARYYPSFLPDGMTMSATIDQRYDALLSLLKTAPLTVVDIREPLKKVIADKQARFYRTDFHWTSFAAEATADYIASLIMRDGPLPGEPGSGTKLGEWMNDRHLGDLAANFLPPDRKREIGPEVFSIRKPEAGETNLLDDKPAPVAVIGNSFVQPYFGFPQRLSNALDRPVFLKWNAGDVGPWATFLQFVQSAEFRAKPPRYVVWQFIEAKFQNGPQAVGEWLPQGIVSPIEWQSSVATAIKN